MKYSSIVSNYILVCFVPRIYVFNFGGEAKVPSIKKHHYIALGIKVNFPPILYNKVFYFFQDVAFFLKKISFCCLIFSFSILSVQTKSSIAFLTVSSNVQFPCCCCVFYLVVSSLPDVDLKREKQKQGGKDSCSISLITSSAEV